MIREFPTDYVTLKHFYNENPGLHSSLEALRAEVSRRQFNGLEKSRAIIQKPAASGDPGARGMLLISRSRYYAWLGV